MEHFISLEYSIFVLSTWLLLEYRLIGEDLAKTNPFEATLGLRELPEWMQMLILLFSNNFIFFPSIITILIISMIQLHWIEGVITFIVAFVAGSILMKLKIFAELLGFYFLAVIGPLWIVGYVYYGWHLLIS